MAGGFERLVSLRYLRARRKEGFISVIAGFSLLGITLGVGTLIVVMAVMNGFREELVGRILGLSGHLGVYGFGEPLSDYDELADRVRVIDGVETVAPVIEAQALVTHDGYATGAAIRGVPDDYLLTRPPIAERLDPPAPAFSGNDAVVIGIRMANRLGLHVGDRITLISPQQSPGPFGGVPRHRDYQIVATFDSGMYEYDNSFVYMPLEAAQTLFRMPEAVSLLEVFTEDPDNLDPIRMPMISILGGDARVWDWQESNTGFVAALYVERNVMFLILTLIILVAAFNVISGLVMLVKDKGRDIAILRTMGATRGMIMRVFLITGTAIGIFGTLGGFLLGVVIAENIAWLQTQLTEALGFDPWDPTVRFLTEMPASMDWWETGTVVTMSLALSVLATVYPAWRAARLDPVEALRYE